MRIGLEGRPTWLRALVTAVLGRLTLIFVVGPDA